MGLDMYLTKRTYIGNKHNTPEDQTKITQPKKETKIKQERIQYIIEEVGYWREANAIHQWFVNNVQDKEDDCEEYTVSPEQLQILLDTVNTVLKASKLVKGKVQNGTQYTKKHGERPIMEDGRIIKDPSIAQKLLPTTDGFFFGGTNYDQYYIEDLKYTKKLIEDLLKEDPTAYYTYSSSW